MPKAKSPKSPNFEKTLAGLEQLVEELEEGTLPLEEALGHYEKGIKMAKECQIALKTAELRVKTLMADNQQVLDSLADSEDDE